jgi:hypothetical protein
METTKRFRDEQSHSYAFRRFKRGMTAFVGFSTAEILTPGSLKRVSHCATPPKERTSFMRRMFVPVLLTIFLLLESGVPRVAHGQTNSSNLTGSWIGTVSGPPEVFLHPTSPIMMTYISGGAMTFVSQNGDGSTNTGVGAWNSTGSGQFAQTTSYFGTDNNNNPIVFKSRASLSITGNQMNGIVELLVLDPSGAVLLDVTGITLTATQMVVEPIGTP